jgi:hypothetical protein
MPDLRRTLALAALALLLPGAFTAQTPDGSGASSPSGPGPW